MPASTFPAPSQRRPRLLVILVASGTVAAAAMLLIVLMGNYEVLEKGRILPYTEGMIYKVRFLDLFTVYVEPENKPSLDSLNAFALAGIGFIALTFSLVLLRMFGDSAERAFRFFALTSLGASYLAADDFLGIHESVGHNLRFLVNLPLVDRPDDLLVLFYAIGVVFFLISFRRLIMTSTTCMTLGVAGLGFMALAVGADLLHWSFEGIYEIATSLCFMAAFMSLGLEQIGGESKH